MEEQISLVLFALLRSALTGEKITEDERNAFSSDMLYDLLNTAFKHDLIHLIAFALKENGLLSDEHSEVEKHIFNAVFRCVQLESEYDNLCKILEETKTPFLPLKGSVIRKHYPETWMRTSSDIDILVHYEDIDKVVPVLIEKNGYKYDATTSHDVSLLAPNEMHVELHFDLMEEGIANESSSVLKNVWEMAKIKEGYSYWHELSDEVYYFYHIAHMAKHFENGGCGIRPFIDLWILDNMKGYDLEKRNAILAEGGILKFAEAARKLKSVWFQNCEYDELSKQMENYILYGGVYGTRNNRIAVQQQKHGGTFRYLLLKVFVPYDVLKGHYPILYKHRWLMPFMSVRRWCKIIFRGHTKRVMDELKYYNYVAKNETETMKKFLSDIGLKAK